MTLTRWELSVNDAVASLQNGESPKFEDVYCTR